MEDEKKEETVQNTEEKDDGIKMKSVDIGDEAANNWFKEMSEATSYEARKALLSNSGS